MKIRINKSMCPSISQLLIIKGFALCLCFCFVIQYTVQPPYSTVARSHNLGPRCKWAIDMDIAWAIKWKFIILFKINLKHSPFEEIGNFLFVVAFIIDMIPCQEAGFYWLCFLEDINSSYRVTVAQWSPTPPPLCNRSTNRA